MDWSTLLAVAGASARENVPLGPLTTYRVGGPARVLVHVEDHDHLERLAPALRACGAPVLVLGNGSNLLVSDAGFDGVALELGEGFRGLEWHVEDTAVSVLAGAALDLPVVARRLADAGVCGFEWAVGVPGTIGGATVMNAGGHGSDMAACLVSTLVFDLDSGEERTWSLADLAYGYRSSALRRNHLVLESTLRLGVGDAEESRGLIKEIVRWRREHQPGGANAGSVFRNPPGAHAGELIERCGLKGLRVGTAHVSDKHANFFQLDAHGRADDVAALLVEVRRRVLEATGVHLESELRLVGFEEAS
jgi:UDP-N-acetylmuramate dehydrogenase